MKNKHVKSINDFTIELEKIDKELEIFIKEYNEYEELVEQENKKSPYYIPMHENSSSLKDNTSTITAKINYLKTKRRNKYFDYTKLPFNDSRKKRLKFDMDILDLKIKMLEWELKNKQNH